MLREQLEQAGLANEALSLDIRRLTADWTKAREELEQRESDWRREEEVGVAVRITETQMKNLAQFDVCLFSLSTVTSAASTAVCWRSGGRWWASADTCVS